MHIPAETTSTERERKAYARQTTHFQSSVSIRFGYYTVLKIVYNVIFTARFRSSHVT
jgi:hypothetical protein